MSTRTSPAEQNDKRTGNRSAGAFRSNSSSPRRLWSQLFSAAFALGAIAGLAMLRLLELPGRMPPHLAPLEPLVRAAHRVPAAHTGAVRTSLYVGVGACFVVALVLAKRKWKPAKGAAAREADELRAADTYATAVDQLDSDRAAVRTAGLHTLDRLARSHPEYRRTVVDILRTYLGTDLGTSSNPEASGALDRHEWAVRRTAQELFLAHAEPDEEAAGVLPPETADTGANSDSRARGEAEAATTDERELRTAENFDDCASTMVRAGFWAPVSVYTAASDGTDLTLAVTAALREFGMTVAVEEPPALSPWFQRFWTRSSEAVSSRSVQERLADLEEAVRAEHLQTPRADLPKARRESAALMLRSVQEQESCIVRFGSAVVIKARGETTVWADEAAVAALEKSGHLLRIPISALELLRSRQHKQDAGTPSQAAASGSVPTSRLNGHRNNGKIPRKTFAGD